MTPRDEPSPALAPGDGLPSGAAGQVHVDVRQAPPTPAQRVAWEALWRLLLGRPRQPPGPLGGDDEDMAQE
jgi:hypothetical protein